MEAKKLELVLIAFVVSSPASPLFPSLDMLKWNLKFWHSAAHLLCLNHEIVWGTAVDPFWRYFLVFVRSTVSKWNYTKNLSNSLIYTFFFFFLPHSVSSRHEGSCLPCPHWELPINNFSAGSRFLSLQNLCFFLISWFPVRHLLLVTFQKGLRTLALFLLHRFSLLANYARGMSWAWSMPETKCVQSP